MFFSAPLKSEARIIQPIFDLYSMQALSSSVKGARPPRIIQAYEKIDTGQPGLSVAWYCGP